jgi:ABC-2 type transport system permease protein
VDALIKAEYRKLTTTQVWFWMLLASLALTIAFVVGQILGGGDNEQLHENTRDIMSTTGHTTYIAVFVLGILGVTTEFRYQTITPTLLATPNRWTLITAKLVAYALIGAAYSLICVIVQVAIALPWLSARGVPVSFSGQIGILLADFAVVTLFALVGLGLGALLKNQIVAVSVGVISVLLLENLVLVIPKVCDAYPFLPSGAANAVLTTGNESRLVGPHDTHLLPIWGGVLMLAVWGIGMAVIGAGITMNRDIT